MSASVVTLAAPQLPAIRRFADQYIRPDYPVFDDRFFQWQFHERAEAEITPADAALGTMDEHGAVRSLSLGRAQSAWLAGHVVPGAWLHEWFADPAHQGGGFVGLQRMIKGTRFLAVSGHALSTTNIWSRLRPLVEFELERLFSVCDVDATLALLQASGTMTRAYLCLCRPAPPTSPPAPCRRVSAFDSDFEACWHRMRDDITVTVDRSSAFMNWRYIRHPSFDYECRRADTPYGTAYFVWRLEAVTGRGETVARLVETLGASQAVADAYPAIHAEIARTGAAFIDFFGTNGAILAGLCAGGMRRVVNTPDFDLPRLFSPLAPDQRRKLKYAFSLAPGILDPVTANDIGRTYFTKGDGNQDRPNR